MAELAGTPPGERLFPIEAGDLRVVEVPSNGLWSVMPHRGREADALAMGFPEAGRTREADGRLAVWFGLRQVLVTGPRPEGLDGAAAVVDQSDAWLWLRIEGPGADAMLARLVPIDLRPGAFGEGASARTLMGHVSVGVLRRRDAIEVLAPRSMAATAAHELARAMRAVAARAAHV